MRQNPYKMTILLKNYRKLQKRENEHGSIEFYIKTFRLRHTSYKRIRKKDENSSSFEP